MLFHGFYEFVMYVQLLGFTSRKEKHLWRKSTSAILASQNEANELKVISVSKLPTTELLKSTKGRDLVSNSPISLLSMAKSSFMSQRN